MITGGRRGTIGAVQIAMLGPLAVRDRAGAPVPVSGRRVRMLLVLLALDPGQVVSSTTLVDRIWGDRPPDGAPNALQALVSRLRRQLPEGAVESHPAGYRLAVAPDAVDVHRFTRLVDTGRAALASDPPRAASALGEALSLWHGQALTDVATADFATAEITRLEELRLATVEDRAAASLPLGDGRQLVPELEVLVAAHPIRERATGLLMRALCAAGRSGDALNAYERTRAALADRLGADPSPELVELHRRVLRGDPALVSTPAPDRRTNLPAELTSFVGRAEELGRVSSLVGESRLTTLTGPGGSGKTRLAVESARAMLEQVPDGVWLVELAPLTKEAELAGAVLAALGLPEHTRMPSSWTRKAGTEPATGGTARPDGATTPADYGGVGEGGGSGGGPGGDGDGGAIAGATDRIVQAMSTKHALLVLDNCEHLLDGSAALVHRLLAGCPQLRILTTSREPLGITGEALWPVEPLALPPAGTPAADAAAYPAIQLLADRAGAARAGFTVDERNVAAAVRICQALDGMPLAIELAAARLRTLSLGQLEARICDRFQLLTGGSRTALPRHQTLRAVVDWSWELLEQPERALLRRLAYFSGGATLAAAERVCAGAGPSGDTVPADRVLDLLTALADKSLLVPDASAPGDQPRFRMLETIKAYGLNQLAEAGETDQIRRAHAAYFLALAEAAEPRLRTGEQQHWLSLLTADLDNLHAALRGAVTAGDTETAIRLVAALGWFWSLTGRRLDGLDLARRALAMPGDAPEGARALAYTVGACTVVDGLEEATAERWFAAAAELAARTDQRHPMLRLVGPLGAVFTAMSWPGSGVLPRDDLDRLGNDPDPWVRATIRVLWVHVSLQGGEYQPALAEDIEAALRDYRLAGDRWGEAFTRHTSAELAALAGELDTAIAENRRAIAQMSELGIPEDKVTCQLRLAEQLWVCGDRRQATAELAIAARDAEQIGLPWLRVMLACTAGELARLSGDLDTARAELDRAWRLTETGGLLELRAGAAGALGRLVIAEGDLPAARAQLTTGLGLALDTGSAPALARILLGLADLALAEEQPARAAELLGAAERVRGTVDRSVPDVDRIATAAGAGLGEACFAEAYHRGLTMDATREAVRELAAGQPTAI